MDYWQLIGVCAFSFLALIMSQVAGMALSEGDKISFLTHSAMSLLLSGAAAFAGIHFGMSVPQ